MSYTLLPTTFKHDGFNFRQVRRQGDVALFAKSKPHFTRDSFEVVIIQKVPAKTIFGRDVPAHEAMPTPSTWGVFGWSYCTIEEAERKFDSLTKAHRMVRAHVELAPKTDFDAAAVSG